MRLSELLRDAALSAVAGYIGTKAMEPVSMKLYELESKDDRAREDAARPGPPYKIAAEKIANAAGLEPNGEQMHKASLAMHYGLAVSWAPLYPILRRAAHWQPVAAGLATGAAMSIHRANGGPTGQPRLRESCCWRQPSSMHSKT
jgi:hypothetical protein